MKKGKGSSAMLMLGIGLLTACGGQASSNMSTNSTSNSATVSDLDPDEQIAKYVVGIFEDSQGKLWFGTLGKGVARHDGKELIYLTKDDGLPGNGVVSIVEDKAGNLWFGTQSGLSRYNGSTFTNFRMEGGADENRISSLMIDSKDQLWVGTWGGVFRQEADVFRRFELPIPEVELLSYQTTMEWITEIKEDKEGNIWIARDGYGVCKYDGDTFTYLTKEDGLPSNNVHDIQEDQTGSFWIGTRMAERDHPDEDQRTGAGGLSMFDGVAMQQFSEWPGLSGNDVYSIYEDKSGDIWVSTIGDGAYRYNGTTFTNYKLKESQSTESNTVSFFGIQSILEDSQGNIWFGCSGGLFRLEGEGVVNVKVGGPWE